jgi:YD repeat-containing protein
MIPFLALWAAHAAPFGLVPVQGELTNAAGTALDGPAQVDFALYADAAATTPSWEESRTLDVEAGAFTAYLGEVVDLDLAWFADNPTAVLVMTVDGDQLDPVPIAYTPLAAYAERAGTADHALDADSLQGLGPDAFLPSDWQPSFGEGLVDDGTGTFVVDRTTVEGWAQEVCFDTEDELTALLDDDYLPADWQPPLGTGFEQLPEGTWVVDEDQIAAWAPGTTYQAGVALDLNGTTFDVDRALVETWARDVAFDTESEVLAVLPADLADGDADTRYSAGAGLVLSGTTMSADRPTIESWAAGVCFDQESELTTLLDNNYLDINWRPDWTDLRDVPADIADGDADTTYTAGNGLQLSGTRFDLDETRVGELARDAAYDTEAELRAALDDDYLPSDHVVAWADIDDRPAGLDDGDDGEGRIVEHVDERGMRQVVGYDEFGRRVSYRGKLQSGSPTTSPAVLMSYDSGGRLLTMENREGEVLHYSYDVSGNVSAMQGPGVDQRFEHDALGRRVVAEVVGVHAIERSYDEAGLSSEHSWSATLVGVPDQTLEFTRDPAGRIVRSVGERLDVATEYDADRDIVASVHVESVQNSSALGTYALEHDGQGRLRRIDRPNSTSTSWAYDPRGRVSQILTSYVGGTDTTDTASADVRHQRAYGYDAWGLPDLVDDSLEGETLYAHDAAGRVTLAQYPAGSGLAVDSFSYDDAGRRLQSGSATSTYNDGDQLTGDGSCTYGYDDEGRRTFRMCSGATDTYHWNVLNQLVEVRLAGGETWTYTCLSPLI